MRQGRVIAAVLRNGIAILNCITGVLMRMIVMMSMHRSWGRERLMPGEMRAPSRAWKNQRKQQKGEY